MIMCMSVCLLSLSPLNGQTFGPEIRPVGQVVLYLGKL